MATRRTSGRYFVCDEGSAEMTEEQGPTYFSRNNQFLTGEGMHSATTAYCLIVRDDYSVSGTRDLSAKCQPKPCSYHVT